MKGKTQKDSMIPRKHFVGNRVIGVRAGDPYNGLRGILIKTYVTVNGVYRNPAYVVRGWKNGKLVTRAFQYVKEIKED
jgi:hypothetical protein